MIKDEYIEEAKDSVTIVTLFKDLYPESKLQKCGSRYRCRCVFHADTNPSLYLEPVTNLAHCFGCNKTFDVIGLVRERMNFSFPQAVEYLLKTYGRVGDLQDIYEKVSDEDTKTEKIKESQLAVMQFVQEFYTKEYASDSIYAKTCRDYAEKRLDNPDGRWDSERVLTFGFGYAPASGHALVDWACRKGLKLDMLVDVGVASYYVDSKGRKRYCDLFKDRLTIPQRNRWGQVIAYTARRLSDIDSCEAKYMNSKCSDGNLIYKKDRTIFGIDVAGRYARQEKVLFLMEGAPDVIGLYTLGVYNAVASNGGSWSPYQLEKLKLFTDKICFVPDSDVEMVEVDGAEVRRGESFVFRSAAIALSLGFKITVKEIPGKQGVKNDVDSYFKTRELWLNTEEEDFVDWYISKVYDEDADRERRLGAIATICNMLSNIKDVTRREFYLDDVKAAYPPRKYWDYEMKNALKNDSKKSGVLLEYSCDDTRRYGFCSDSDGYYSITKSGKKDHWSNFFVKALFHISDENDVSRIIKITNKEGTTLLLEIQQGSMTKLDRMKEEVEKLGNFRYKANTIQHELLKDYVYDNMPSAIRLEHMGWHSVGDDGFFAFANGIAVEGRFFSVDGYGIVDYKGQKYFLPAFSELYKEKSYAHKIMKRFEHVVKRKISIEKFFNQLMRVYPDHGMQELAFVMATMFLDIIREECGFFPIMFHYGITESGKTQLAITASRFFQYREEITNLESSTLWAMNDKSTAGTNLVCHMDEYKNSIGKERIDFCKGVFDNAGRIVKSETSSKRKQDDIETGHIITGQEIPNFDPALLTRSLLMEFYSSARTPSETHEMDLLKKMRNWGLTQITIKILKYRKKFRKRWQDMWLDCLFEVKRRGDVKNVGERILETWTLLYAVVKCLHECGLQTPIDEQKLFDVCISSMIRQQELLQLTDEVAIFWLLLKNSYRYGEMREQCHFNVRILSSPMNVKRNKTEYVLPSTSRPILMLCMDACMGVVNRRGAEEKKPVLNEASLIGYLKNTPEYLGTMSEPTKFKMLDRNGEPIMEMYADKNGIAKKRPKRIAERAMIFDYNMVRDKYSIDLLGHEEISNKEIDNNAEVY